MTKHTFILTALVALLFILTACTKPSVPKHATFEGIEVAGTIDEFWTAYRNSLPEYMELDSAFVVGDFKAYMDRIDHRTGDTVTIMADMYHDTVYCIYFAVCEDSTFAVIDSIGNARCLEIIKENRLP